MSLIENDLVARYWQLPLILIFLLTAFAGGGMVWIIEIYRSLKDRLRPPLGLAILRWRTNWLGDSISLPATITVISIYYDRVRVDPSFWTEQVFFILPTVVGIGVSASFIIWEESKKVGGYPKGKKINANRVYHCLYMAWMVYLLSGFFIRALVYHQELPLLLLALVAFSSWVLCFIPDGKAPNRLWGWVVSRWPERTQYL